MPNLYRNESSNPKRNAQRNLADRSHYVTLRFHKSRVLSARHVDGGLLFAIVTSNALDMNNTKRGFRYAIFDLFGNVLERPKLEDAFRTREQAAKAMWDVLNRIDAKRVTMDAIDAAEKSFAREMEELRDTVRRTRDAVERVA